MQANVSYVTPVADIHLDVQDSFITNEDGLFDKRIYVSSTYFLEEFVDMPSYP